MRIQINKTMPCITLVLLLYYLCIKIIWDDELYIIYMYIQMEYGSEKIPLIFLYTYIHIYK